MTLQEWRSNESLAIELKKILQNPVFKNAVSVLESLTMAQALSAGNGLLQYAEKANVLFGYDTGRASVVRDIETLAEIPQPLEDIQTTYSSEF
jgi:hypothetical protein